MGLEKKIKLGEKEKISHVIHRYWLTYFWSWFGIAILFATPFFFMFWLFQHGQWGQMLFVVPIVLAVIWLIHTLYIWQKNALVITTDRIIDIEQRGIFEKVISDISLEDIEDVAGKIKGFWGTMFRYGNTMIEASEGRIKIVAEKVKYPEDLQRHIKKMKKQYLDKGAKELRGDLVHAIREKIHELELEELERIEKSVRKRIISLKKEL